MNDNSIMPFGEHSGKAMGNVPESWLLWFWGENKSSYKEFGEFGLRPDQFKIMKYIEDSLDAKNLD